MTRDQWLADLSDKISPLFRAAGHPLPPCILSVGKMDGLTTAHYKGGNWHICVSDQLDDKIVVAETLIHNLIFRACGNDTGQGHLMNMIGYGSILPDGNKLAWGLRRLVRMMPPYPPRTTREGWLTRLVEELRPLFVDAGLPLPKITTGPGVACPGFPKRGILQFASGECCVYIWPQLSKSMDAPLALVRELPRCAVDVFGPVQRINELATTIGLVNEEPTPALKFLLTNIIADIGPYPEN